MIRKLLYAYNQSAYVGYTTTPFANIFIDRRSKTNETGDPHEIFIVNLPHSHYIGPSQILTKIMTKMKIIIAQIYKYY